MPQETKRTTLLWQGGTQFEGGVAGGPRMGMDGDGKEAVSPMVALLLAAAGCSAIDVVLILEKMRVGLREFSVEAAGVRREQEPRRYLSLHLVYRMRGEGLDEAKARRAIDLSIEKYCSVIHSMAPDIRITYDVSVA
jgi:putative redox protein